MPRPWLCGPAQRGLAVPRIHKFKFTSSSGPCAAPPSIWNTFTRETLTAKPLYPECLGSKPPPQGAYSDYQAHPSHTPGPGGAVTTTTRCFQTGRGRVPVLLSAGAKQITREGSCRGQACSRPHSPTVGLGPGSAGSQPQGLARAAGKVSTGQRHPKAGLRPGTCPRQGPPTALPAGRGCLPAAAGHVGLPSSGSQWWQLRPPGPGLRARSEGARASRLSFCHSVLEMAPGRFCRARQ